MNEQEPDPLQDLFDDYLDGRLDEDGTRQLEEALRADADIRRRFVLYARLHADLHLEVRARRAGARALSGLAPPPAVPRPRWWPAALTAAVAVALLGGWLLRPRPGADDGARAEASVAWLVNAQNCQWSDDVNPAGDMRAGTLLRLERGLAEVQFRCGARVVLEGPAGLELLSDRSARLVRGRLTARVPPPAVGFEVLSPQGKVIDLGTEFGMAVADGATTEVYVFDGQVEAHGSAGQVNLTRDQGAQIAGGKVTRQPGAVAGRFVRAIVPPPVVVPRSLRLTFDGDVAGSLRDADGRGTGLTHRLPGTGARLPDADPNLRLDPAWKRLELTTTRSDINNQVRLHSGEYLGVRLADLGFTGPEDFAVTAVLPNIPALESFGQFGLYAGTRADRNVRGGLISWRNDEQSTQFLVNNDGGRDTDLAKVGLLSAGTDLQLTLQRVAGTYSLTVENLTARSKSTLTIRHPDFLDDERDLFVGLFGANPYSDVRKTLVVTRFEATVWTVTANR